MSQPFVTLIDIDAYNNNNERKQNQKWRSFIGDICVRVSESDLEKAYDFLKETLTKPSVILSVTKIGSVDDIVSLLDRGAAKVIVDHRQLDELKSIPTISPERLVLNVESVETESLTKARNTNKAGIYVGALNDVNKLDNWLRDKNINDTLVYCNSKNLDILSVLQLAKTSAIPIISYDLLSNDNRSDKVNVAELLATIINSDRPDKLISTLVTDEEGIALGLVYSSPDSISESLKTGRGVYQSRKRGLWYKGETSGDIQELVRIELDCDSDCLKYVVRQKGKGMILFTEIWRKQLSHFHRILSSGPRNMFWSLQGAVKTSANT